MPHDHGKCVDYDRESPSCRYLRYIEATNSTSLPRQIAI